MQLFVVVVFLSKLLAPTMMTIDGRGCSSLLISRASFPHWLPDIGE